MVPARAAACICSGHEQPHYRSVDREAVRYIAVRVLGAEWLKSDELEWILANILTTQEVQAYSDEMKKGLIQPSILKAIQAQRLFQDSGGDLSKMMMRRLRTELPLSLTKVAARIALALFIVGTGAGLALDSYTSTYTGVLTALVAAWCVHRLVIGSPPKPGANKAAELLAAMIAAADHVTWGGSGLSFEPIVAVKRIQTLLNRITEMGAVWDAPALAIVSRAATRHKPFWRLFREYPLLPGERVRWVAIEQEP